MGELRLSERQLVRPYGEDPRPPLLNFLLEKDHILMRQLNEIVHLKLVSLGNDQIRFLIKTRSYVDHCESPDAFGYAMLHRAAESGSAWNDFRFDHGETSEDYCRKADGLLEETVKQLLTSMLTSKPSSIR